MPRAAPGLRGDKPGLQRSVESAKVVSLQQKNFMLDLDQALLL